LAGEVGPSGGHRFKLAFWGGQTGRAVQRGPLKE